MDRYAEEKAFLLGSLVEPTSVAYNAVIERGGGIRPGDSVLILGSGPIGAAACAILKAAGASKVIMSEPSKASVITSYSIHYTKLYEDVKAIITAGLPAKMFEKKRVLVLTPDATRTCPLPMMIGVIQEVIGTKAAKLDFMVALGTHTPLPEKEILKLYGITTQKKRARFQNSLFLNHRWDRPETFQRIGRNNFV